MATKKTEETKVEEVTVPEEDKYVTVFIPRDREDPSDVPVWVNDRSWLIQKGVKVRVPREVAEVLANAEKMKDEAYAFEMEAQGAADRHMREL